MTRNDSFPSTLRLAPFFGVLLAVLPVTSAAALTGESDCPTYDIEGSIESPADPDSTAQVAVYLHVGSEAVVGHQVFATFTDASGTDVGEAVVLTTGADGRASAPVPPGAENVSFVAESPDQPSCLAVTGSEPRVALEIRPTGGDPAGGDAVGSGPGTGLAHTGPVTAGVAATAVLLAAAGCGVWMGRGRRGSRHEPSFGRG